METVLYYDCESRQVVRIPAAELRPGVIQVRIDGIEGIVWVSPEDLREGPTRHPPFDEEVRDYIRQIEEAFAEHRSLSFEEWEEGFRRDADPAQEIAVWLHAAGVYQHFAQQWGHDAEVRRELYRVIVTCLTTSPDGIRHVLRVSALSDEQADQVVQRFFGQQGPEAGAS